MGFDFDFTSDAINQFNMQLRFGYDDAEAEERESGRETARKNAVETAVEAFMNLLNCEWRHGPQISRENGIEFGNYLGELGGALYFLHNSDDESDISESTYVLKNKLRESLKW